VRRIAAARASKLLLFGVLNGLQGQRDLTPGQYRIGVAVAGTDRPVLGPLQVTFDEGLAHQIYVVGSANNGTLTALVVSSPLR
jgi:hypothetical protein